MCCIYLLNHTNIERSPGEQVILFDSSITYESVFFEYKYTRVFREFTTITIPAND